MLMQSRGPGGSGAEASPTLPALIQSTIARLATDGREVLELIAVAGRPWTTILLLLQGTLALAHGHLAGHDKRQREAMRCISRLRHRRVPLAKSGVLILEAGLLHARQFRSIAATRYGEAEDAFEAQGMLGFASAARVRQAELTTDGTAVELRARADRWFDAQHIANPAHWTRMYAPISG